MTMTLALKAAPAARLDYAQLRRAFFILGLALLVIAPLSRDPLALAVGGLVPWLVLRIVGTPTLPAAAVFFILWQWLQTFARVLVGLIDGEALGGGLYGPWVANAYWYMLASQVALALAFRLVLGSLRPPSQQQWTAHHAWRPVDLFLVYLGAFAFAVFVSYAVVWVPALDQPLDAASRFKVIALFLLFAVVLSTGRGTVFLLSAIGLETVMGFSGLLSDFRGVFVYLAMAALAVRIRWSGTATATAALWLAVLMTLALFWTAVKSEYREVATGSTESQNVRMPIDVRLGYIAGRVVSIGDIDWSLASYALLNRLAYVDLFGSVIGVKEASPEPGYFRQWNEASDHVFKPRFLFPDKPALSDIQVYVRLARGDASEQVRAGTSISVGYLAENYVDFGFPGMLGGVFAIGLLLATITRYFMSVPLPWVLREAIVLALLYAVGGNGVEVSLPKLLGGVVMFAVVYALLAKFAFPMGVRWLDSARRIGQAAPQRSNACLKRQLKPPLKLPLKRHGDFSRCWRPAP